MSDLMDDGSIFELLGLNLNKELMESLKPAEKEAVLQILQQIRDTGDSSLYKDVINIDYEEIPVDIDTFIEDDRYIGKITKNGTTIYPYWRNALRNIFSPNNHYSEIIFTGAIGLGKTTIAITAMSYILYQLLCLKDPQEFYGLQGNSEIVLAFFNVNLDLSYGVAYKKMQSMLMESPWFLEHGKIYGRQDKNKNYVPDKKIRFRVGSQENHGLGQDIFCLTGDTIIATDTGLHTLEELNGDFGIHVYNYSDNNVQMSSECEILETGSTDELYVIMLENGDSIKCTANHKLLLKDGTYKCAKDLTEDDELLDTTIEV